MSGFEPVDPKQSFPELEERVLARWELGSAGTKLETDAAAP